MKILFITERYPPFVAAGNRVYYISKYFSNNHEVFVFTRKNDRLIRNYPKDNCFNTNFVNKIYFNVHDNIFLSLLNKIKILNRNSFYYVSGKKEIKKNEELFKNFDLIIASGPTWDAFYLAEYLFDKYNIPYILDYRDPWISNNNVVIKDQKRIINKAKAVVAVTNSFVGKIKQITNYKKDILIIENGVDLNSVKDLKKQIKDNKLRIGFAGYFVNYHNVDVLLKAISNLPKDVRKNIIFEGCGGLHKKYEILSKKLGVVSNYYGHLSLDKMNKVLNNCHLFYLGNSNNNAISGKFYIYLSLDRPILCYTFENSELDKEIKNNKLGFVCNSESELTEKIKEIYNNRNMLSKNNFKIKEYIKNYDWKVLVKKYTNLIDDINGNKKI